MAKSKKLWWQVKEPILGHTFEGGPNEFACKICGEGRALHDQDETKCGTAEAIPKELSQEDDE